MLPVICNSVELKMFPQFNPSLDCHSGEKFSAIEAGKTLEYNLSKPKESQNSKTKSMVYVCVDCFD